MKTGAGIFARRSSTRCGLVTVALAIAIATGGCSLTRPSPVKKTFLLDPPVTALAVKPQPVSIRMGQVTVAAPYRDRAFVYRTADVRYESDFYHEFFVPPGAMVAQATGRALAAANLFTRVVPPGTAQDDGRYVLEGFVSELYADARAKPAAGVIGIEYYLMGNGGANPVVWSGRYRERVELAEATPESLATAWNEALGRVLSALLRDLAATPLAP